MKIIEIRDLTFSYREGKPVLKDINLTLDRGDFAAIMGTNGSGKSTLVKNILGELKPDRGEVKLFGQPLKDLKTYRQIGYVPQVNLVEKIAFPITVREMVVLNLYESFGFIKLPRRAHKKRVEEVLGAMDLLDYGDRPVGELSGGLQQRTMIARAMINNPDLLILDEPTVGIDKASREHFFKMIQALKDERGLSILLITHELEEAQRFTQISHFYEMLEGHLRPRRSQDA
ncbi:MAG: metal ABC transporter ATP-binding protein [Tissierellia bacterium]|nr:metal ABC transporter ATP-binding protein [Tissierellia bacterium]